MAKGFYNVKTSVEGIGREKESENTGTNCVLRDVRAMTLTVVSSIVS